MARSVDGSTNTNTNNLCSQAYIEFSSPQAATAAKHVLSKYDSDAKPDFLFVAGNDRDDEIVFKWAKQMKDEAAIANVQTVTVGDRNSVALSTLPNGTTGTFPLKHLQALC